jgi:hypothetical protein
MEIDQHAWQRLLATQDDVVRIRQAIGCGWTRDAIRHRVDRVWQLLFAGVLATFTGQPTDRQRFRAALLHGGSQAALTSVTACRLHGLERVAETETVHVAVPAASAVRSRSFVRVWPTVRSLRTTMVDGLAVVTAERAVVDAALELHLQNDVRALVAEAVQRRRTSVAALLRELQDAPMRGSLLLRRALDEVAGGARSAPEAVLLAAFRALGGLPPYELNADVCGKDGRWLARPDFVFRAQRLIVEVDGAAWHLSPERWASDVERHTRLEAAGWTVLRYAAKRVLDDPEGVAAEIAAVLATRA